jgi:hypothetical protein
VTTVSTKSLLDRIRDKVGDKLGDWLFDGLKWLAAPLLLGWAVLARHWLADEWACMSKPACAVRGSSLGVLIAVTIVTTGASIVFGYLLYRTRNQLRATAAKPKTPQFHPIDVEDKKLNLRWIIRRPPHEWLSWRNIASTQGPLAVNDVLDGPFHAVPGCMAAVWEIPMRQNLYGEVSPTFDENCRTCGHRIFVGLHAEQGRRIAVWPVRAYALEELQRMQRTGTKLPEAQWSPPIVLENPEYWKLMLPPASRSEA